jgi:Protein of unknown function (DUF3226)
LSPRPSHKIEEIKLPYLIVGEGPDDAAFFRALIEARKIPKRFHIACPNYYLGDGGFDRLAETVAALKVLPGSENLRGILVVCDRDNDPIARLSDLKAQFVDRKMNPPASDLIKGPDNPSLVFMMLPWGAQEGVLETICWDIASETFPIEANCVSQYLSCTNSKTGTISKLSKTQLRCLLAALYPKNPSLSLTFLWDDCPQIVPLAGKQLDSIATFLADFDKLIAAP